MASSTPHASHPIRCRCGALRGELARPALGTRAICYCRDCQAFAHFLGKPEGMLDALGGTDIVAVRPRHVTWTQGAELLTCMSLSEKGTLRWYSSCCKTPIGNTPRNLRQSHVGLIHTCLETDDRRMDEAFGPVVMRVNAQSAKGTPAKNAPITFLVAVIRYLASVVWSRFSGAYRVNPFFHMPQGIPRATPRTLSADERASLYSGV